MDLWERTKHLSRREYETLSPDTALVVMWKLGGGSFLAYRMTRGIAVVLIALKVPWHAILWILISTHTHTTQKIKWP